MTCYVMGPSVTDAFTRAQLTARQLQEQTGLSLAELAALPLDEYSRLAYGQTPAEAAIAAYNREQDARFEQPQAPSPPRAAPAAFDAPQGGTDVASLSMDEYAVLRSQLGMGHAREYGRGILSDQGGTDAWVQAAQRKAGRHGWQGRNVVEPPSITDRYVRQDDMRDARSVAERFGTPGNSFQVH